MNPQIIINNIKIYTETLIDVAQVVVRMNIFNKFFKSNRDPSLQYVDGADGTPFGKNGVVPQLVIHPEFEEDETPTDDNKA
jgi:hypothetical protein